MILPPRPLNTAHLAQAVGRCHENQATQLGGEETLWWEKGFNIGALFLLFSARFSFWLPPVNSWHLFISICRSLDQGMTLVIQTFWEMGFIFQQCVCQKRKFLSSVILSETEDKTSILYHVYTYTGKKNMLIS